MISRHPLRVLIVVALVLFAAGPSLVGFATDWLWFADLGYLPLYWTRLSVEGLLFAVTFAVSGAWLVMNLQLALASLRDAKPIFTTREGMQVNLPGRQQLRALAGIVALIVAALLGLYAASRWETSLLWWNAVPFGQADPILGHDVGFYVFGLPFYQFVRGLLLVLVVLAALGATAIYLLSGSLTSGTPTIVAMTRATRQHLGLLVAVFFLLLAAGAWLQRAEYLIQPSGLIHGAGYADVYGRMPATWGVLVAALVGVACAVAFAFGRRNWPIPVAVGVYLVALVGGDVYGTILQRFVVTPNEQVRETPFIVHNIAATRTAFALDGVDQRELSGDALLSKDDIARNAATLDNVRLWDHQPLLETFGQIQEIRTYYDFASVDNDRYRIDGTLRQVMLSARELNSNSLPNRTWVNERLTFTHGYGLTLGPVNQVTSEGLPVLFIKDIPPAGRQGLTVDQPGLYFGELSNDYVIVHTRTREFHYPKGDDNVFTQYTGSGGVTLGTFWRKALFALRFGAYQIVLSDDIGPESRILFNRNIRDRVRTLAPFLTFDRDPYLVLVDGRLVWLYDAYTTSNLYPYSTPSVGGVNYMRNAVKLTIDAYDGTVTAYLADPQDPIARTYARIFPGFFRPMSAMPAAIRAHVRYPEDIFAVQSMVYATYHMTQPSVFYNREDQWEIPSLGTAGNTELMQPYYTIMRLPGEADPEFIQMLPFTPRNRDNLAAWLVARSDGEHYGHLRVFEFPKQKLVFGPRQVVARMNQDQTISPQVTLWNQQGSEVIWGTLMVIPIEESLIYVRPLYLRAPGGRIPELRRVLVAYQNQIVMEPTLDAALQRLFGETGDSPTPAPGSQTGESRRAEAADVAAAPAATPAGGTATAALAAEARAHYERAVQAQRSGDWATYGEQLRQLGAVLDRMRGGAR